MNIIHFNYLINYYLISTIKYFYLNVILSVRSVFQLRVKTIRFKLFCNFKYRKIVADVRILESLYIFL